MKKHLSLLLIIFVLFSGGLLLFLYALNLQNYLYGDSSTIALMTQDIIHGKIPIFFYGQRYNGSAETILLSLFVFLFGSKTIILLIGKATLSLIFLITLYYLGKLLGGKWIGLIALTYCCFPPFVQLHWEIMPNGYLSLIMILGNLLVIIASIIANQNIENNSSNKKQIIYWLLFGFIAGLGFWTHFLIVFYLLGSCFFLLTNIRFFKLLKYSIYSGISFFLGSLPFWYYNIKTQFSSFHLIDGHLYHPTEEKITFMHSLNLVIKYHIPKLLGILNDDWTGKVILFIFIISIIYFIKSHLLKRYFYKNANIQILYLLLTTILTSATLGGFFVVVEDSQRYFLPLYTSFSIMLAYLTRNLCRKKIIYGLSIFTFVLVFNIQNIKNNFKDVIDGYASEKNLSTMLINFMNQNNIEGFFSDFYIAQPINYMTNKKIVGSELMEGRPPTDELVSTKDNIAIFNCDWLRPSVELLCKSYKDESNLTQIYSMQKNFKYDKYRILMGSLDGLIKPVMYNFESFGYSGKSICPDKWSAKSSYNDLDCSHAFDRNLDRYWSSGKWKSPDMYFEIDLNQVYKIYKMEIFNTSPHLNNFPSKYIIEISLDGNDWKQIKTCIEPEPLFWSGPRLYYDYFNGRLEIIFTPAETRYIRIKNTDYGKWAFIINELFVYEYLEQQETRSKTYIKPAKTLYKYLIDHNIKFIYTDVWLSAKIKKWSNGKIQALTILNHCYPNRKHTSRNITIDKDTALIIDKETDMEFESLISKIDIPVIKKDFGKFIYYKFQPKDNWQSEFLRSGKYLYWLGKIPVINNTLALSFLLTNYSDYLISHNNLHKAHFMLHHAIALFPRNIPARHKISRFDKKQDNILKHRFTPKKQIQVTFENGIKLYGYTLKKIRKNTYEISYYWHLEKYHDNIAVFVHFTKNDKTLVQNDHKLLDQYGCIEHCSKELLVERFLVNFPESGKYQLVLGLYNPISGKRTKIKTHKMHNQNSIEIGDIDIK
jgi:4-amino-4-deoxy-L-arabinose transferase-like glycosyltransferase